MFWHTDANKDTEIDGSPFGVLGTTVGAELVRWVLEELLSNLVFVILSD